MLDRRYAAPPSQAQIAGAARIEEITVTVLHSKNQAPEGHRDKTLQRMRAEPHRIWRLREIAQGIGLPSEHSLRAELGRWIGEGIFQRVDRGPLRTRP